MLYICTHMATESFKGLTNVDQSHHEYVTYQ